MQIPLQLTQKTTNTRTHPTTRRRTTNNNNKQIRITMKYLIAVDGSPSADNAFQFAAKLFNKENDQLFVISCVEEWGFDYIDDISGAISMAEVGQLNQAMEKNSNKVLSKFIL